MKSKEDVIGKGFKGCLGGGFVRTADKRTGGNLCAADL